MLITQKSNACSQKVSYLKIGEAAPCSGYLFSPKKELEVRIKVDSYDLLLEANGKRNELIKNLDNQILVYQSNNVLLVEKLNQQQARNFWEKTLYFSLGAFITGYIATNVGR